MRLCRTWEGAQKNLNWIGPHCALACCSVSSWHSLFVARSTALFTIASSASIITDITATTHTNWQSSLRSHKTYWNKEAVKANNLEAQQVAEEKLSIVEELLLFCSNRKQFVEVTITAVQPGVNVEDAIEKAKGTDTRIGIDIDNTS